MTQRQRGIKILSVNISEEKGTIKKPVDEIKLTKYGVEGDAHAGVWHRQVSMLGLESIKKFTALAGREINYGEFAENITTEGMLVYETSPLDRFVSDNIVLEVTQIGKECHGDACAIFREVGNCVMPKEGIFCRVIKGGALRPGIYMNYKPKIYNALVITLSDRASTGEYEDKSGPRLKKMLEETFKKNHWKGKIDYMIIPDDQEQLKQILFYARDDKADFVFTSGGTGIGPRDITPDVVASVIDKQIPGIMEMIRMKYGKEKPNALVSRGIAGLMDQTLVFTLPGSVRAVNEYMAEIEKSLWHLVMMLHGIDAH